MNRFLLDACALIAFLVEESGRNSVSNLFTKAIFKENEIFMHKANLLEVYYDLLRRYERGYANTIFFYIQQLPINFIGDFSSEMFSEAGRLKMSYKISFADSIALASASVHKAELVTSDHHEFDAIEGKENIKFFWIR